MRCEETKPYVVAEIGVNHNGDAGLLLDLMCAAKESGCDAVKLQSYLSEHLIKDSLANKMLHEYQIDDWGRVAESANALEIDWFVSCFCKHALKKIAKYKPCRWKSAAPDLVEASKWKSKLTWWASYDPRFYPLNPRYNTDRLEKAEVVFLCRSDYPALASHYFTKGMNECLETGLFEGLSDHTPGLELVEALGSEFTYFEKHFKMDDDCIDNFALNPDRMRQYVELIHCIHGDHSMENDRLKSYQRRFE